MIVMVRFGWHNFKQIATPLRVLYFCPQITRNFQEDDSTQHESIEITHKFVARYSFVATHVPFVRLQKVLLTISVKNLENKCVYRTCVAHLVMTCATCESFPNSFIKNAQKKKNGKKNMSLIHTLGMSRISFKKKNKATLKPIEYS